MIVGYARVSSQSQSLEIQHEKLCKICEHIFEEKKSGTNFDREELKNCLNFIRKGDTLVVCKLDRLARSISDLCKITTILKEKEVELKVLDQQIDTSTPTGRLLFNLLGCIAEFENEIRRERQMEGIQKAKAAGKYKGKKFRLKKEQIANLIEKHKNGSTTAELLEEFKIKRSTLYLYLKRHDRWIASEKI